MPLPPDVDAEIDALLKRAQWFFADQMEDHGFGRKTFQFEADANGNVVVHHVNGKLPIADYVNSNMAWVRETDEEINIPHERIPVYMIERGETRITVGRGCGEGGRSGAHIYCWGWSTVAHELGHAFGLPHDFRDDSNIMSYGADADARLSRCTAEWLDVHPFFNVDQSPMTKDEQSKIKMLPLSLESLPNAIRLRFEVTDPDGLHHAFLVLPGSNVSLLGCKSLSGEHSTIEFVTTELRPKDKVDLEVIDARGNSAASWHSIDIRSLLPPPEVISIADVNLAAAIRKQLRLAPKDALTTHMLRNLRHLFVHKEDGRIKDFAALQHAHALTKLHIYENKFSDISSLAGLTQLINLSLSGNNITDISPLAGLTKLTTLHLSNNNITDISSLAGLTKLTTLSLFKNNITDISPLAGLTKLVGLDLYRTGVSDISPLSDLTQLVILDLSGQWHQRHIRTFRAHTLEIPTPW